MIIFYADGIVLATQGELFVIGLTINLQLKIIVVIFQLIKNLLSNLVDFSGRNRLLKKAPWLNYLLINDCTGWQQCMIR
jgi:hypothetical protein